MKHCEANRGVDTVPQGNNFSPLTMATSDYLSQFVTLASVTIEGIGDLVAQSRRNNNLTKGVLKRLDELRDGQNSMKDCIEKSYKGPTPPTPPTPPASDPEEEGSEESIARPKSTPGGRPLKRRATVLERQQDAVPRKKSRVHAQ
jgi:hypothetical protein